MGRQNRESRLRFSMCCFSGEGKNTGPSLGYYEAGQIIDISVPNESDGTNLGRWSSTGRDQFEGLKARATKFIMPSQDVEISFNLSRSGQQDKE